MHISSAPALRLQAAGTADRRNGPFAAGTACSLAGPRLESDSTAMAARLADTLNTVQQRMRAMAADPDRFRAVLQVSFGTNADAAVAETLRQQTLHGDFSWMPTIRIADSAVLNGSAETDTGGAPVLGAYHADSDTVYILRDLLRQNAHGAETLLLEEIGHALDTRLNRADTPGDEGDVFARLVTGQALSAQDLAALRAENDSGSIELNGERVNVERGLGSTLKKFASKTLDAVTGGLRGLGTTVGHTLDGIVAGLKTASDVVSEVYDGVRRSVLHTIGRVLDSDRLAHIMSVAQWVPMPFVKALASAYQLARAGYQVFRGVQHGSWGTVLAGVAGLASGSARIGAMAGAPASLMDSFTRVGDAAAAASALWLSLAGGDFTVALDILRGVSAQTSAAPPAAERPLSPATHAEPLVHTGERSHTGEPPEAARCRRVPAALRSRLQNAGTTGHNESPWQSQSAG